MIDISRLVLDYRKCLRDLWNQYFALDSAEEDNFKFEIDKSFSLIDDGLFTSLVIAKAFEYQISKTKDGYYNQIIVVPKNVKIQALCAKSLGLNYNWENITIPSKRSVFKFMEIFSWSTNEKKEFEIVRVRLTESDDMEKYVGYDFLLKTTEVLYYKKE